MRAAAATPAAGAAGGGGARWGARASAAAPSLLRPAAAGRSLERAPTAAGLAARADGGGGGIRGGRNGGGRNGGGGGAPPRAAPLDDFLSSLAAKTLMSGAEGRDALRAELQSAFTAAQRQDAASRGGGRPKDDGDASAAAFPGRIPSNILEAYEEMMAIFEAAVAAQAPGGGGRRDADDPGALPDVLPSMRSLLVDVPLSGGSAASFLALRREETGPVASALGPLLEATSRPPGAQPAAARRRLLRCHPVAACRCRRRLPPLCAGD